MSECDHFQLQVNRVGHHPSLHGPFLPPQQPLHRLHLRGLRKWENHSFIPAKATTSHNDVPNVWIQCRDRRGADAQWKATGWDLGMGCASMHTMTRLHATYVANGHALIWVVDANERGCLGESVQGLEYMLQRVDDLLKTEDRRRRFPLLMYVWLFLQSRTLGSDIPY